MKLKTESLRLVLAVIAGFVILYATVALCTMALNALWSDDIPRTTKENAWFLWAALLILIHLGSGVLSGYLAAAISANQSIRTGVLLGLVTFVYLSYQILGDWGHHFRFFWSLFLTVSTIAGILLGSLWHRRRFAAMS